MPLNLPIDVVSIDVACLSQDSSAAVMKISIADTGIGIAEEHLPLFFQKFSQLTGSSSCSTQGVGLGLAISKHLIEMMGGACGVESTEHKGSTFC